MLSVGFLYVILNTVLASRHACKCMCSLIYKLCYKLDISVVSGENTLHSLQDPLSERDVMSTWDALGYYSQSLF